MVMADISMVIQMEYLYHLFFHKKVKEDIEEQNITLALEKTTSYWMDCKNQLLLKKEKQIESLRAEMQILRNLVKQKDGRIEKLITMLENIQARDSFRT